MGDRVLFDVVVPRKLPDKNNKKGECMARMLEDKDDVKALANAGLRVVTVRVEMQRGKMVRGLRLVKVDNDSSGTIPETEVVLLFDGPVVDMPPKEHVKDSGCTVWELGISGERATRSAKKTISKALETTTITVENAAQLVNEVLDANKNCHVKKYYNYKKKHYSFALVAGGGGCDADGAVQPGELNTYYGEDYVRDYDLEPSAKAACLFDNVAKFQARKQAKRKKACYARQCIAKDCARGKRVASRTASKAMPAPKKKAPAKKKAAAKKARMAAGLQPQPLVARTEDCNQFCAPCDTYSVVRRALRLADARRAK